MEQRKHKIWNNHGYWCKIFLEFHSIKEWHSISNGRNENIEQDVDEVNANEI